MIPQTRNASPRATDDYMYTVLHNLDAKQLYEFQRSGMVKMIGSFVGIFLSGIAVTLGVSSVLLVISKRRQGISRRDYFICAYTIVLLSVLLALETVLFVDFNSITILFFQPRSRLLERGLMLQKLFYATLAVLALLADGLLVLRCFLVQKALGRGSSNWGRLFWVFPMCVWATTVVSAFFVSADPNTTKATRAGILAITSNIVLNAYATSFITIRLFLHRRVVMAYLGNKGLATQHVYVISILLESAAINIPIATIAVIWLDSTVKDLTFPIGAASQVLAATLIIYRTALGRVFNQQAAESRSTLEMREGVSSSSGSV